MTGRRYRLTAAADEDVESILRESAKRFGPMQRDNYAALLERAAEMVAENPDRPGSWTRDDLAPGVRCFHVEHAAGRRGAAAHLIYYLRGVMDDGSEGVVIARILHRRMEPEARIAVGIG